MHAITASVELRAGAVRMALRPDLGGCVTGLWVAGVPFWRSLEPLELEDVRNSASYPLVPYSNRIAFRQFDWRGHCWSLAPNFPGPHAIHGVGWRRPWQIASCRHDEVALSLEHAPDADWPFAFASEQRITVREDRVRFKLSAKNQSPHVAPIGLGWHPHFPRRAGSHLEARVTQRWNAEPTLLPTELVAQDPIDAPVAELDLDNCFEGWDRRAAIRDEVLSLALTSNLDRLVIWARPDQPVFAVEPVSHANNAINLPDPESHGLVFAAPGQTVEAWMELAIRR